MTLDDEFEVFQVGDIEWLRHKPCDKRIYLDPDPVAGQQVEWFPVNHRCGPIDTMWNSPDQVETYPTINLVALG